jgi:uncharacterized protein (DUF2236 family)
MSYPDPGTAPGTPQGTPQGNPQGTLLSLLPAPVARQLKQVITGRVVAMFNDRAKGERPVMRRPDGLFGPRSVTWRVHGDVTSMMVGGLCGLLLQMLHPAVLAGVWDHSAFRTDLSGRLRRTARFIATTTYSSRADAEAAMARVRRIHDHVEGVLPDGTPYRAGDPASLAWVHATETWSFLAAFVRYAEPRMSAAEQDRYFAEMAVVASALGADPVPRSRAEAERVIAAMRPSLRCDARTREVSRLLLRPPAADRAAAAVQALTAEAAIDLMPAWARRMHGVHAPRLGLPLVRAGTFGVAQTVRWAFA